jgi:hypothetical protein
MKRRFSSIGFAVFATSLGLAGVALAQSFPTHFAQRCAPDQLRMGPSPQDPCQPQFALFGLNGPTVIGSRTTDVDTTGAVETDRARRRPKEK